MITCNECIALMYPDDPRIKSGLYHLSGCDYCNKPQYYRNLEQPKPEPEISDSIEIRQLRQEIRQLRQQVEHLDKGKSKDRI